MSGFALATVESGKRSGAHGKMVLAKDACQLNAAC